MAVMNMIQALNSAHDVMMERDDNIVVMGEDVGYFGGVFRVTEGLQKKYGKTRVFDTPIAEMSSPFASYGFDGMTVFTPATWANKASADWLCVCPPKMPPP